MSYDHTVSAHLATPPTCTLMLDSVTLQPLPSPHIVAQPNLSDTIPRRDSSLLGLNHTTVSQHASPVLGGVVSLSPSVITNTLPLMMGDCSTSGGSSPTNQDQASPPITSRHSTVSNASSDSGSSQTPSLWMWPIAEAVSSCQTVLVPSLPSEVAETLSRAWGDVPRQAVVIPIWAYKGNSSDSLLPQAVLVLGLNLRRPYNKACEEWVDLLRISLGGSLAAVLIWEAEKQRAEQLAQLDAAKTSFFSNVSHELRTPLTLFLGPIQNTVSVCKDSKIKETLKLVLRNVSRLSRLVDSLMDFTRLEARRLLGALHHDS
ncbi:hypothetical protein JB92DRAFT_2891561 [Gautieria morchelliformis]|nr:hypothetical protein JB92DRAFT_2891561 [Gautieria morchelliformis]